MKTKFNPERSGQHSKFPLNILYSLFFILILYSLFFILYSNKAYAATEFISTVKQSGGNYSTLASWEAAIQVDLTASTTAVYSGTGTGSLSQGNVLELFRSGTYQNATSTLVATTSTQILVRNYYNSGAPITLQSGDEWRLASSTANMFTVSGSGVQLGDTPIAIAQIDGAWTNPDTTAVTIDGWTTDATHYIKIYTTTAARHTGKWDDTRYRLVASVAGNIITISDPYTRVEGLQMENTSVSPGSIVVRTTQNYVWLVGNIGRTAVTGNTIYVFLVRGVWGPTQYNYVINNIAIQRSTGSASPAFLFDESNIVYAYNNTAVSSSIGFRLVTNYQDVKNNLAYRTSGSASMFTNSGGWSSASNYNASSDATAPGTNSKTNQTFSFLNSANNDFHLSSSDTSAKDAGANLSADPNFAFSDDIDGNTRPVGSAWDIGADETYGVIIIIE